MLGTVSSEQMQAARIVTGAAMALWIGVSLVPGLQQHARAIRRAVLALYLLTFAGFVTYVVLWR